MYEYLLPIGSVVKLKKTQRKVMIYGILQKNMDEEQFDYVGVPYPEGYTTIATKVAFNHDDIEKTLYRGFEDNEREQFYIYLELMNVKQDVEKIRE